MCVSLEQQGRQGWERADKEPLFVLCCFKELSPCLTHTQTRGFPQCWACELYRIIPQSSVNRDVGSHAIRPHIWQSIDIEKEMRIFAGSWTLESLGKWEPDEAGKLNRLSAHSLLRHHIRSAYTISTLQWQTHSIQCIDCWFLANSQSHFHNDEHLFCCSSSNQFMKDLHSLLKHFSLSERDLFYPAILPQQQK